MDKADLNPLYIIFLYILRCLVPLGLCWEFPISCAGLD